MKRTIAFFTVLFMLIPMGLLAEKTNTANTTNGCVSPTGYTMLECMDNKTIGDAYLVYKAENTSSATTATVAADPTNSSNKVILFSNKNYGHYLKLNVTLPCNRTLNDYEAISFKVYSVAGIGTYQNLKVGINQNMFDVANNGTNTLTSWTTLERAFPTGFSTYSSLNTFTLELGFRTNSQNYYIDNIMLKEKATASPCGGFTATLNPGSGTCAVPSVTETAEGTGVTLPSATPSVKCGIAGYTFAGWSQSAVTETTSAPALISAGAWAITQNTTLYAVYTDGTVYNSNPVCVACLNGTTTGGWLLMEDFECKTLAEPLAMKNIYGETIVGTATVAVNPTVGDEKVAHVTISSGNYNTLLKLNLTLPTGKVLANYEQLSFDLYRLTGDANYKKMYIWVDGVKVFEDAGFIQQAPATTWTTKTYNFTDLPAGNSFELALGISTDAGNYMIDNVKLKEKVVTNTFTVTFNPGAGTCPTASLTETAASSGVTLPALATPSTESVNAGWTFSGWAASAVNKTTSAPSLLLPSTAYFPLASITLYAVYSNGTHYDSYPTTATSTNGVVNDRYLMVEDFETKFVNTALVIVNTGGNPILGTAGVSINPNNLNERSAQVLTTNYENIMQLQVTLPAGKTASNYDQLSFDFYWKNNDWKKMGIFIDGVKVFEDADYISQSPVNVWTTKTYDLSVNSGNVFTLAMGISTDAGNYYIDNIKLRESITTELHNTKGKMINYVENTLLFNENCQVRVVDLNGRVLISAENTRSLDISQLAKGIYIVKAMIGDNHHIEKFMKK